MGKKEMKTVVFNLSKEDDARLTALAERLGMTKTAALRRGIEIHLMMRKWQDEGAKLRKIAPDGEVSTVEIIG